MPKIKQKTRRAVSKRFKITKTGKVKCSRAFKGHLLTSKTRKRKRALSGWLVLGKKEAKNIKALMPYNLR